MYVEIYNTAQTNGRWNLFCCLMFACFFRFFFCLVSKYVHFLWYSLYNRFKLKPYTSTWFVKLENSTVATMYQVTFFQRIQPTIPRAICHAKDIASVGWNVSQSLSHSLSSVFGAAFSSWIDDQNTVIGILHWSSSSKPPSLCSIPSGKPEDPSLASVLFVLFWTPSVF